MRGEMPGRTIPDENAFRGSPYDHPTLARRRGILRETLDALGTEARRHRYRDSAEHNLRRWAEMAPPPDRGHEVRVLAGDWGDVTAGLTREFGATFAVLNMANAFVPGGAYVEGTSAQEENIFRRSDCHFAVPETHLDSRERYLPAMTDLIEGRNGRVYLDTDKPRVCIRGAEKPTNDGRGYTFLADDEVFPFFELRAAAVDLRDGSRFDPEETRRRIAAQLDTLIEAQVRHAVLGASGCGAFQNPPAQVARLYREEVTARAEHFRILAFAIRSAGDRLDNFGMFADALAPEQARTARRPTRRLTSAGALFGILRRSSRALWRWRS